MKKKFIEYFINSAGKLDVFVWLSSSIDKVLEGEINASVSEKYGEAYVYYHERKKEVGIVFETSRYEGPVNTYIKKELNKKTTEELKSFLEKKRKRFEEK